jgi:DNA polymerase-3 subunit epsilon
MLQITIGIGNMLTVSKREQKGKSLLDSIDNYIVIDLETTGLDPSYDEIIEFAAVRVENGAIVSEFQSLVKPPYPIDSFITELTGITNEMLSTAPSVDTVLPNFLDYVGQSTVVAHNANFDVNFLYDACSFRKPFSNDFIDTMRLSRRLFRQERHHRLGDLTDRFGIVGDIEHRALSDVLKTQACYEYMKAYIRDNNISLESLYPRSAGVKASDITSSNMDFNETTPVYDRAFVFTGTLQRMVRKEAMQLVVDMGGICGDGITAKTNYLVLGNNDYCSSIKDGKSSKHKKAERYKAEGMDIEIISENVFYEMVAEYQSASTAISSDMAAVIAPSKQIENKPDQFEAECLSMIKGLFPNIDLRYSREANRLRVYTSFWSFLTISNMKKGYFVQPEWDFDLTRYQDSLLCESTKSCKRIFLSKPEDLLILQDYITQKEKEMTESWDEYVENVSSTTANKRRREYEKITSPV